MKSYRSRSIQDMIHDPDEIWFERDARKRMQLKRATPPWVNRDAIRQIYIKCMELNQKYPSVGFVVHHVIPIKHKHVCGLHVPANLEIVSSSRKKQLGRKFNQFH